MRKEVVFAGLGWISAGVISLVVWLIIRNKINANSSLEIGIIALVVGILIIAFGNRISRIIDRKLKEKKAVLK